MAIFRINKEINYTTIDNNIFKNKDLSYRATGLLTTMLSLPDNWDFTEMGLVALKKESRETIRKTLKELEECGYLIRTRNRDEKGRLTDTTYDIYETPMSKKPMLDKPMLENYTQLNTNNINNLNNKYIYKGNFKKPTLEEIKDYCLNVRHNKVDYQYFYDYFTEGNWIDSKGNKVKNWKQKIVTWEKRNHREKEDEYENYWKGKLDEEK